MLILVKRTVEDDRVLKDDLEKSIVQINASIQNQEERKIKSAKLHSQMRSTLGQMRSLHNFPPSQQEISFARLLFVV